MKEQRVYLDSNSVVKRYLEEKGSNHIDKAYNRSEAGEIRLAFSLWNIGETIGAFNRYLTRKLISEEEFTTARSDLISETLKLSRLGSLEVIPVTSEILVQSWAYVVKHHIYEADALQISSGKEIGCGLFLGADKKLIDVASAEGLNAFNVESTRNLEL